VTVAVKSRIVTVKGPKGELTREFKHMQLDMQLSEDGKSLKVDLWFGNRERVAAVR
jgi:large subunit ribosomal protein L9e